MGHKKGEKKQVIANALKSALSLLLLLAFVASTSAIAIGTTGWGIYETITGVRLSDMRIPDYPQILKDEVWQVTLAQPPSAGIIIYEDERVRILVNPLQFQAYGQWAGDHRSKASEVILPTLEELAQAAETDSPATDYSRKYELAKYGYVISDILKSGQATLYDKRSRSNLSVITIRDRVFIWCPACGNGAWNFYLPDGTLFFSFTYMYF